MLAKDLPLLELFTKLRQAGLPLGIDEYRLLLESLRSGFGIPDRSTLARLCCTLWVKSAEEKRLFDKIFEQVMLRNTMLLASPVPPPPIEPKRQKISPPIRDWIRGWPYVLCIGIVLGASYLLFGRNRTPKFISKPIFERVGEEYIYNIEAFDINKSDTLTIRLLTKTSWLVLNDRGKGKAILKVVIADKTNPKQLPDVSIKLQVTDSHGATDTQLFPLSEALTFDDNSRIPVNNGGGEGEENREDGEEPPLTAESFLPPDPVPTENEVSQSEDVPSVDPTTNPSSTGNENKPVQPEPTKLIPFSRLLSFSSLALSCLALIASFLFFKWLIKLDKDDLAKNSLLPQQRKKSLASAPLSEPQQQTEKEGDERQQYRHRMGGQIKPYRHHFIETNEYFSVTRRQMKQSWRYWRRLIREGPATELDVAATIDQIGRQGLLVQPVLVPRRVNRTELLLLIDRDGSMSSFHELSNRLAETALQGGRLGKTEIYYFHNFPIKYDPNEDNDHLTHHISEYIEKILASLQFQHAAVLFISDAGAARSGVNPKRIQATAELLKQLKQRVRYLAWLNPIPRSRWLGTTAAEIARLVPMFELNRRGLDNAIDMLRGKSRHYQG